jgi:hypothetical protein
VDIIGLIIVVLFVVVPLIGVLASKMRELSQPQPPRPLGQGDSRRVQEQIDEFLRRAGQGRGGPAVARPAQTPVAVELIDDDQVGSGVGQQVSKYLDTSDFRRRSDALGGEMVQADKQFSRQVGNAFSGEVGQLSTRRGETSEAPEVTDADVVEAEVVEAEDPSRPTLEAAPIAGSGLSDLLGSPDNIVHAIIMSEILRRPEL